MINSKYFTTDELKCHGTGECKMDEQFIQKLNKIREELNRPMIINSGYRSSEHNSTVGGAVNSPHIYGRAVDVSAVGGVAYEIIRLAIKYNITGIGVSQRGTHKRRFIHLDDMTSATHPRPWIWSYK